MCLQRFVAWLIFLWPSQSLISLNLLFLFWGFALLLFEDILRNLFYERYLNVKMRLKLLLITSKPIELLLSLKKCRISCLKFFLVCIFVNLSYSSSTVFFNLNFNSPSNNYTHHSLGIEYLWDIFWLPDFGNSHSA